MDVLKCIETGNEIFIKHEDIKQEEDVKDTVDPFCSLEEELINVEVKEELTTEIELKTECFSDDDENFDDFNYELKTETIQPKDIPDNIEFNESKINKVSPSSEPIYAKKSRLEKVG